MKILAWDSSGASESVALLEDDRVRAQRTELQVRSHSEQLLPMIEGVLSGAEMSLPQIDLFAVTVGPGSFTGLRIGLSAAKALALIYSKPVAPVSTLLALAEPHLKKFPTVLACLDARLGEIYAGVFRVGEEKTGYQTILPPQCLPLAEVIRMAEELAPSSLGVGSAFQVFPELREIKGLVVSEASTAGVEAASVGRLAQRMVRQGELVSGRELKAQYLRASEAENRLRARKASVNLN